MDSDEFDNLVKLVLEKNKTPRALAEVHYARAYKLQNAQSATPEQLELARNDIARIQELLPADDLLALRARGPEFQKTRLQIGMEAPDIEGVDINGTPFKLSDYRGKVIMLDFWGDW